MSVAVLEWPISDMLYALQLPGIMDFALDCLVRTIE